MYLTQLCNVQILVNLNATFANLKYIAEHHWGHNDENSPETKYHQINLKFT